MKAGFPELLVLLSMVISYILPIATVVILWNIVKILREIRDRL